MRSHLSAELRQLVAARARYRCEYCLIREEDTFFGCEVDHIISVKHGGATTEDNLAYACMICNRRKGSDLGSILPKTGELVRFFHPRRDIWKDHFEVVYVKIFTLTEIGEVTARIFEFNKEERILERAVLVDLKRYP
ncbi:MAG TPA: HNH endonuclease signature motif containing protein [Pyrinomonadaceae bacterium]